VDLPRPVHVADGVVETDYSTSPCTRDTIPPSVRVTQVPRHGCASRAFVARVRVDNASPLSCVRVRLDGPVIRETNLAQFTQPISPRGLRAGRHRLSVTVRDASGNNGHRCCTSSAAAGVPRGGAS
jgi:hypothetical protein